MSRKARFCRVCGQAFHGHGLWGVCPGCRAEMRVRKRMSRDWNLPDGCTPDDVDARGGEDCICHTCARCDYIDEDAHVCGLRDKYVDGESWCPFWEEQL